jgi:hypothetical protein
MDDSYYGHGRWSGGRYSFSDHLAEYLPSRLLTIIAVIAALWFLVEC